MILNVASLFSPFLDSKFRLCSNIMTKQFKVKTVNIPETKSKIIAEEKTISLFTKCPSLINESWFTDCLRNKKPFFANYHGLLKEYFLVGRVN